MADVTEMVERVARGLYPEAWDPAAVYVINGEIQSLTPVDRQLMQGMAYARAKNLINAMREPTKEMQDAAKKNHWTCDGETGMGQVWKDMIDAALGEHQ